MGIKTAIILSCAGGVDYTQFRELTTVEAYVDNLEHIIKKGFISLSKDAKRMPEMAASFLAVYKHPPTELNKHLVVLNELFNKSDMLESMYATLVSSFSNIPKAVGVIQRVESLLLYTRRKVDRAMLALSTGVEKHQPEYFARCVDSILKAINQYSSSYVSVQPVSMMRVIHSGDVIQGTQFSVYLCFTGLTDLNGYTHSKYHVVLSCVVDRNGKFTMSYSLQPTLLLPGKFKSTDLFTSPADCMSGLKVRMCEEGFNWR